MQAFEEGRAVSSGQIVARVIDAGSRWRCEIPARQRSIRAITRGTVWRQNDDFCRFLQVRLDQRWRNAKKRKQSDPGWERR